MIITKVNRVLCIANEDVRNIFSSLLTEIVEYPILKTRANLCYMSAGFMDEKLVLGIMKAKEESFLENVAKFDEISNEVIGEDIFGTSDPYSLSLQLFKEIYEKE